MKMIHNEIATFPRQMKQASKRLEEETWNVNRSLTRSEENEITITANALTTRAQNTSETTTAPFAR